MNPFASILAPLLLLPVAIAPVANPAANDDGAALAEQVQQEAAIQPSIAPLSWLQEAWQTRIAQQVSIEQHIVIRIAPRAPAQADPRVASFYDAGESPRSSHIEERKMGKCVPVDGVAGVQITQANKLVLYMRDTRVVSAGLDKGCNARDYYSGFYVARSADGMICAGRDKLQARNGASCKLGKLHQLVEVGD